MNPMYPTTFLRFVKREMTVNTELEGIGRVVDRMVLQQWWSSDQMVALGLDGFKPIFKNGEWRDVEVEGDG